MGAVMFVIYRSIHSFRYLTKQPLHPQMLTPRLHNGPPTFQEIAPGIGSLDTVHDMAQSGLGHLAGYATLTTPIPEAGSEAVGYAPDLVLSEQLGEPFGGKHLPPR